MALFGRALGCGVHDFGGRLGKRTVLVCEKWAGVWLPEYAHDPAWAVQGVAAGQVADVARAVLGGTH